VYLTNVIHMVVTLNAIIWLIFITETQRVFCEAGPEFIDFTEMYAIIIFNTTFKLNIIYEMVQAPSDIQRFKYCLGLILTSRRAVVFFFLVLSSFSSSYFMIGLCTISPVKLAHLNECSVISREKLPASRLGL
jgi:hypothetical protein